MKLLNRMGLVMLIAVNFFCAMSQSVSAKEITKAVNDNTAVGVAETGTISSQRIQMTEAEQKKHKQFMSGEIFDLDVGESMVIGSDEDGIISITCVSSSSDLTKASWQTSYKTYDIAKTVLGVETVLVRVDLECTWYANGVDGYIQNLKGTYTKKYSACYCSWDDYKSALPYSHALWLNLTVDGSSYSIMLAAYYHFSDSTLSFGIQA